MVAHFLVTVVICIVDDHPAYAGPWALSGVFGDLPERWMGIAHWQNLFMDMPLLGVFAAGEAYLAKKVFGSYLLPWDD